MLYLVGLIICLLASAGFLITFAVCLLFRLIWKVQISLVEWSLLPLAVSVGAYGFGLLGFTWSPVPEKKYELCRVARFGNLDAISDVNPSLVVHSQVHFPPISKCHWSDGVITQVIPPWYSVMIVGCLVVSLILISGAFVRTRKGK